MANMDNPAEAFEFGIDPDKIVKRDFNVLYDPESVLRYRAENIDAILNNTLILAGMINHHYEKQVPRLKALESYYISNNPAIITGDRRREKDKSDHRIRHGWASIISDFLNSYVLSNPVKLEIPKGADRFGEILAEFNHNNDIDSHNMEIGLDQNNFGRAYELIQRTADDVDRIYRIDPTEVFMIYDETVRTRVIGACRYYPATTWANTDDKGNKDTYHVELYTADRIIFFKPIALGSKSRLEIINEIEHFYRGVPIVEYRSNRYKMSVYEKQIPLIDAYDSAQSDTANYMTDFNDAILAIEGRIENGDDASYMKKMKDANMLVLIPEENDNGSVSGAIKAHYLTKSYDVQGVEAYKTRLKNDIFNTASTPDLSDDKFGGNQSGEALKYKMFGLQQKRSDKEKYLAKGFRIRYKLLENLNREISAISGEVPDILFSFTPNLPKTYLEEMKSFVDSGGQLSQTTMLKLLSFIDDPADEIKLLKTEQSETLSGFDVELRTGDHVDDDSAKTES